VTRRRQPTSLDPHPSPAELARKYQERTGKTLAPSSKVSIRIGEISIDHGRGELTVVQEVSTFRLGDVLEATRRFDVLELVLRFAPRTKKNGTTLGIKQSKAYRRYEQQIVNAIAPAKAVLGLPLPDRAYRIAVSYYVDRAGKRADRPGLDQGLFDALENAGVVSNDWWFRNTDGTQIVFDDPTPRVEIRISPIDSVD
jgi:Holliday junction resolvase RusA-like endonuclease